MAQRTLDVLVTGANVENLAEKLDRLFANYENINIYEVGAPSEGCNRQLTTYAFRNCCPLNLGTTDDMISVAQKVGTSENPAVIIIESDDIDENVKRNIIAAQYVASVTNAQVRKIKA